MWSAAIVVFIGTLLLIGLGIIDPVKDNHPDPVVITGIVTALILSGLFAYGAEKLHIKPPTVNVTVQRLEKAGFLYREADEKDQRISRIYMTEKGKQAKESGMKKVQDNEKILLDGFSEEDLCLLRRFRAQLVDIALGFRDRPAVFRNQAHEAQLRRFVFDAQKRPRVAF